MSTYNTNFAPVPPNSSAAQMNLVNGMQSVGADASAAQPFQQLQPQLQQQFHQQPSILQEKHLATQTSRVLPPPPQFNSSSFANKYLPPSSAAVATSTAPAGTSSVGSATVVTANVQSVNGPMRHTVASVQGPVANLPPHLRPGALNGPLQHVNGGGGVGGGSAGASANSSRTASPALYNMPTHHQQQMTPSGAGQQSTSAASRMPTQRAAGTVGGPPTAMSMTQPPKSNQPGGLLTSSGVQPPPAHSVNGLSYIEHSPQAAPTAQQQLPGVPPMIAIPASTPLASGMQNLSISGGGSAGGGGGHFDHARFAGGGKPVSALCNQHAAHVNSQPGLATIPAVGGSVNQNSAGVFGLTTGPGTVMANAAAPVAHSVLPLSANVAAANRAQDIQNNDNNNKQMSHLAPPFTSTIGGPVLPPPVFGKTAGMPPISTTSTVPTVAVPLAAASLVTNAGRKPMYPTNPQLPPVTGQQQQQQQLPSYQQQNPYEPAYQHHTQSHYQQQPQAQQQQMPGMFNGQSNSGPLQYQSQQPAPVQFQQAYSAAPSNTPQNSQMSVANQGFSRLWGQDTIDLMQNRHILSPATLPPPKIVLHNQFHESINCNPSIMRCTLAKIPESNSLLQKSRLPLGILIHPFRDINSLPVIQCPNIVRCRLCRTYINPFVYFVDSKMWKCNLCYRVNELPEDFQFDPATKTYGDVTRRPEVRSSTIEFIAPSEYMLRPPQPAIYLFLFDVSIIAQQSGYLEAACVQLNKHLDDMPGDARTQVGFIAYDSYVHFYTMAEGFNQPHELTLLDIDDPFLPRPDGLLVNLKECKELIKDLLQQLPKRFEHTHDPGSALGAALQVAYKLMQPSGGRITVFQTCLPNRGPGSLEAREDPNNRSAKDVAHLNPATDFYKRYALECSGYQIAVDLFLMNQQYSDMATISGISKHSGGCVYHFPLYQKTKPHHVDAFKQCFKRYLTRKIGFEAVMRIRCTRGLQVHTFHGNFFVRSTDLLSLPNVNPDAGYGMQISYEESLTDVKTICFQAALLYTNSEGERRIRVHTLCLPVTASLPEVMHAADSEAIIGLLSKMAVDRSVTSNMSDARDAFINATVDVFNAFKIAQNLPSGQFGQLIAPRTLALLPLYILSLLKHPAFRVGTSTRLDDRVYAMDCMKILPLDQLMKYLYPEFYKLDFLFYNLENSNHESNDDDEDLPEMQRLQLSAEFLDSRSMFLLDCGTQILIYVGLNVPSNLLESVLGIKSTAELPDYYYGLPNVNSNENDVLRRFILRLNEEKPYTPLIQIIRDTSTAKSQFTEKLIEDRSESSLSYYEFLQHIRTQVK